MSNEETYVVGIGGFCHHRNLLHGEANALQLGKCLFCVLTMRKYTNTMFKVMIGHIDF